MAVPRKGFRRSLKDLYDWLDLNVGNGGDAPEVTSEDITDSGAVGRTVIQASTEEQARSAIGAVSQADFDALEQRVATLESAGG